LVITHERIRISNVKKVTGARTSKYDVFKLISSEEVEQYRQRKVNHITLTEEHNGEKLCERHLTTINSVAEEVLGIMELANKGMWFDAECQAATEDKNKAYRKMQQYKKEKKRTKSFIKERKKHA
jgi:hypothetical protein